MPTNMFSMLQQSTPWKKKADKKKKGYSDLDGNLPSQRTVPLHVYEKLQLQLMNNIDTLADRDAQIASLTAQVKVHSANASVFTYKIESLEQTIQKKDNEIEALRNELSVLRANDAPSTTTTITTATTTQQPKEESSKKEKKPKREGGQEKRTKKLKKSKSNSSLKKSASKKKKRSKRMTLHNHELSNATKECVEKIKKEKALLSPASSSNKRQQGSSAGSRSTEESSTNRGSTEMLVINAWKEHTPLSHPSKYGGMIIDDGGDETMHSQSHSIRSNSGWNFRPPAMIMSNNNSAHGDKPILDPTMFELADDVSDLTRSHRSELRWSPSPVVKRRQLVLSEADRAALGIGTAGLILDGHNKKKPMRRSSLSRSLSKQVDDQPGESPGIMSLWQVNEVATVEEEQDDILEDDSIASSSMSC